MSFIPDSEIVDSELLFRAIPNKPNFWKQEQNRPSSALFKDDKGVSVDRDGQRDEGKIVEELLCTRPNYGIGKLLTEDIKKIPVFPKPDPNPESNPTNGFHALIQESMDKIPISDSKARKLSKLVNILSEPKIYP